jgi:hypothetical protein
VTTYATSDGSTVTLFRTAHRVMSCSACAIQIVT